MRPLFSFEVDGQSPAGEIRFQNMNVLVSRITKLLLNPAQLNSVFFNGRKAGSRLGLESFFLYFRCAGLSDSETEIMN